MTLGKLKINSVLIFHTVWVLFIYLTWPFIFHSRTFDKIYLVVMLLTLASSWTLGGCFLSKLENKLRKKYAPQTVYEDRCIHYYGKKWLHTSISKYLVQAVFGILLLLSIYLLFR